MIADPFWIQTSKLFARIIPMLPGVPTNEEWHLVFSKMALEEDKDDDEVYRFYFVKVPREELPFKDLPNEYTWFCVRIFENIDGKFGSELIPEQDIDDKVKVELYFLPDEATKNVLIWEKDEYERN